MGPLFFRQFRFERAVFCLKSLPGESCAGIGGDIHSLQLFQNACKIWPVGEREAVLVAEVEDVRRKIVNWTGRPQLRVAGPAKL